MKTALAGLVFSWLACSTLFPAAARADCPAPRSGSAADLPGKPFGIVVSSDGCWMFVSLMTDAHQGAVAVLRDVDGEYSIARLVKLQDGGTGETLTHDGRLLVVSEWNDVAVFEVGELEQGSGPALAGHLDDGHDPGAVYVITSLDDQFLFVSDENSRQIDVFNLAKWRADHFRGNPRIGHVPTGVAPVGLALSPDGHWLYSTSEVAPPHTDFDDSCRPEHGFARRHPEGLLLRIDIAKAATNPHASLSGGIQAGCNPVRIAVSPDGRYLWVTARGDNAVLRVPASALTSKDRVNVTSFDVGGGPVGIAVRPDGKQVWVALSNRFHNTKYNPEGREVVGLLGADQPETGSIQAVSEPASAFPRELVFLPDGRTFAVGLFAAKRIEFFATPS